MRLTFTGKIIAMLLFTVVLLTLATSLTVHYYLSDGLNRMSQNEIDTKADAVDAMLKDASSEVKGTTYLLASRPDVAAAIVARDKAALVKIAKQAQQELRIEFVTIADAEGKVWPGGIPTSPAIPSRISSTSKRPWPARGRWAWKRARPSSFPCAPAIPSTRTARSSVR